MLEKHDNELFGADEYNEKRDAFLVLRQLRMNIWAVRAMLARVYLYKGDDASKELAYNYAKAVIECGHFRLMESNTSNRILFPEHIFSLHMNWENSWNWIWGCKHPIAYMHYSPR